MEIIQVLQNPDSVGANDQWIVLIPGKAASIFPSRETAVDYAELRSVVLDMPIVF